VTFVRCLETSVICYPVTVRHIPEERNVNQFSYILCRDSECTELYLYFPTFTR